MKNIVFLLFSFTTFAGLAQDQLFKKDNSKFEVKVIEINETEVKYKLFSYQDGPTIIIAKKDVAMIIYQNGTHEVFNMPATETKTVVITQPAFTEIKPESIKTNSVNTEELLGTKNLIATNILEPINGTFNVSYLRELLNNYMNIYVPISTGFGKPYLNQSLGTAFNPYYYNYGNISNFTYQRKVAEFGLGIHFQTSGKKAVTHFVGPYFSVAQYNGTFDQQIFYSDPYGGYYSDQYQQHSFVMNRYYFMINNGILFRITKSFNMVMMAAIGHSNNDFLANDPRNFRDYTNYPNYYTTQNNVFPINAFKFNFSMGYRF